MRYLLTILTAAMLILTLSGGVRLATVASLHHAASASMMDAAAPRPDCGRALCDPQPDSGCSTLCFFSALDNRWVATVPHGGVGLALALIVLLFLPLALWIRFRPRLAPVAAENNVKRLLRVIKRE